MAEDCDEPRSAALRKSLGGILYRVWGGFWGALCGALISIVLMVVTYKLLGWPIGTSWIQWLTWGGVAGLTIALIRPAVGEAVAEVLSYVWP